MKHNDFVPKVMVFGWLLFL